MIKNFILSVCMLILFSTHSFSAGSNDTTTTKVKSDYTKAVELNIPILSEHDIYKDY